MERPQFQREQTEKDLRRAWNVANACNCFVPTHSGRRIWHDANGIPRPPQKHQVVKK